jgi:hypothetical protein
MNNALRQWVNLVPVKSTSDKSTSPLRDISKGNGPRALLIYYFGDKTKGAAAI